MGDRLLILGASARAAAASARRAGLEPFAIDLFADRDTRLLCNCLRCPPDEYPEGLLRLARQAPPMPWMYTGGLENYPNLINELARERDLWGNHAGLFAPVRDPFALSRLLLAEEIPVLAVVAPGADQLPDCRWLRKPLAGSGGGGIRFAERAELASKPSAVPRHYFQQFANGRPLSAVFVSMPWRYWLLGVTAQLIGTPWLHAKPFAYCGNIGPIAPTLELMKWLNGVGHAVTTHALKFGVWGIDYIQTAVWPFVVEVNPRFTASIEVLEFGYGASVFTWHHDASTCMSDEWDPDAEFVHPNDWKRKQIVGKAIYYALRSFRFPTTGPWDDSLAHVNVVWRRPDYADIPHSGDVIEAGHPVLTIFAEADSEAECLRRLQSRAAELDRLFGVTP